MSYIWDIPVFAWKGVQLMDINKYVLFADVANTKNFTKSGERMGYTQPGVSHVLKAMERELGFSLFLRTPKGVTLTSDAEAILPLVRELLAVNEQLEQTVSQINGLEKGHLCIATFASISRSSSHMRTSSSITITHFTVYSPLFAALINAPTIGIAPLAYASGAGRWSA